MSTRSAASASELADAAAKLLPLTCLWQMTHTSTAGTVAAAPVVTLRWQNSHWMAWPPSSTGPAWTVCGNSMGWAGALPQPKGGLENHDINSTTTMNATIAVASRPASARGMSCRGGGSGGIG